mgnify:CR=1 FL=1
MSRLCHSFAPTPPALPHRFSVLSPGVIDADFPFQCAAGLLGDSLDTLAQSGPQCASACWSGHYCSGATSVPTQCPKGDWRERELTGVSVS